MSWSKIAIKMMQSVMHKAFSKQSLIDKNLPKIIYKAETPKRF